MVDLLNRCLGCPSVFFDEGYVSVGFRNHYHGMWVFGIDDSETIINGTKEQWERLVALWSGDDGVSVMSRVFGNKE